MTKFIPHYNKRCVNYILDGSERVIEDLVLSNDLKRSLLNRYALDHTSGSITLSQLYMSMKYSHPTFKYSVRMYERLKNGIHTITVKDHVGLILINGGYMKRGYLEKIEEEN